MCDLLQTGHIRGRMERAVERHILLRMHWWHNHRPMGCGHHDVPHCRNGLPVTYTASWDIRILPGGTSSTLWTSWRVGGLGLSLGLSPTHN